MSTRQSTVVTDASGNYSFADLSPGTYVVIPEIAGLDFTPRFRQVVITDESVADEDFTTRELEPPIAPPPQPYIISGTVTSVPTTQLVQYGGPYKPDVAGVFVTLTGPLYQQAALTDSNGNFQFSGLPNGTYTLFFSKVQHVLTPSSQVVVVSDANISNVASVLTVNPNVSGTIRNEAGTGMGAGITVNLTGPRTATVTTAVSSIYQLNNAPIGVWTITPQLVGYKFDPPFRTATSATSIGGQDFTAIPV